MKVSYPFLHTQYHLLEVALSWKQRGLHSKLMHQNNICMPNICSEIGILTYGIICTEQHFLL